MEKELEGGSQHHTVPCAASFPAQVKARFLEAGEFLVMLSITHFFIFVETSMFYHYWQKLANRFQSLLNLELILTGLQTVYYNRTKHNIYLKWWSVFLSKDLMITGGEVGKSPTSFIQSTCMDISEGRVLWWVSGVVTVTRQWCPLDKSPTY